MHEISPSEPLATLLKKFGRMGGQIDYVQIGLDAPDLNADLMQLHKAAAIFTAQIVMEREMQHLRWFWQTEKAMLQKAFPGLTQSTLYRVQYRCGVQIRPDQAESEPVPLARFFALPPPYDRMQELPAWLDVAAFTPVKRAHWSIWQEGYPYAFLEPPYGLRLSDENVQPEALFQAINRELFGDDINRLSVYEWSTDWIDFLNFQPENDEIWDSALWTVARPLPGPMIGIAYVTLE
jgi:hypothetical protein